MRGLVSAGPQLSPDGHDWRAGDGQRRRMVARRNQTSASTAPTDGLAALQMAAVAAVRGTGHRCPVPDRQPLGSSSSLGLRRELPPARLQRRIVLSPAVGLAIGARIGAAVRAHWCCAPRNGDRIEEHTVGVQAAHGPRPSGSSTRCTGRAVVVAVHGCTEGSQRARHRAQLSLLHRPLRRQHRALSDSDCRGHIRRRRRCCGHCCDCRHRCNGRCDCSSSN